MLYGWEVPAEVSIISQNLTPVYYMMRALRNIAKKKKVEIYILIVFKAFLQSGHTKGDARNTGFLDCSKAPTQCTAGAAA